MPLVTIPTRSFKAQIIMCTILNSFVAVTTGTVSMLWIKPVRCYTKVFQVFEPVRQLFLRIYFSFPA